MFKFKTQNPAPVTYQALCIANAEKLLPGAIVEIGSGSMLLIKAVKVNDDGSVFLFHDIMGDNGEPIDSLGSSTYGPGATFTVFKKM